MREKSEKKYKMLIFYLMILKKRKITENLGKQFGNILPH